jgi:hypothetical protein
MIRGGTIVARKRWSREGTRHDESFARRREEESGGDAHEEGLSGGSSIQLDRIIVYKRKREVQEKNESCDEKQSCIQREKISLD